MKKEYAQRLCFAAGLWLMAALQPAVAQRGMPSKEQYDGTVHTVYPQHEDFKESMLSRLKVPAGFKVSIAATGLGKPRMMAMGTDGAIYITRRDQGDVLMLKDKDGDGRYEDLKTVVTEFTGVHGIALHDGWMYLVATRELKRGKVAADGSVGPLEMLIKDLPDAGQHPNRTIYFGPDGKLYITVGSTCNDCVDSNPENATLLQASPDGKQRRIYARGLRNTIGIDWNPQTGALWGADQGRDWLGDEIPPEELNQIKDSAHYGWPWVYADKVVDISREDPMGSTKAEVAKKTESPGLTFPAHSAPIQFYFLGRATGIPTDYQQDALMTMHGSWNRKNPDGYNVIRVKFSNGQPTGYEDFLTGFFDAQKNTRFGRPAGLLLSPKGTVFISDDENGVIYSVTAQ